jgi:hypothetical protein
MQPFYNTVETFMLRIAILTLLAASHAFGCVCVAFLTPKAEWQQSSLIFVGRVETVSPEFDKTNPFRAQRVTVRVEEAFKGVQKDQLIQIEQTGSDCELKYSKGWKRLLYLGPPRDGRWHSPGCDRSTDPELASDDLRFLRALPGSANRTRISGEVMLSGDPGTQSRPLSGVNVTLRRDGGPPTTLITDAKGVFEVYDLPRGTYVASIGIPSGLKAKFGYVSGRREFSDGFPLKLTLGDAHATAVFYVASGNAK